MSREVIVDGIAQRLAPRFGLSATAIAFGLTTAIGIGTTIHQNVTRFDAGYESAVDGMREGKIEVDGKVIEIKTETDKAALRSYELMKSAEQNYSNADDAAVKSLQSTVAYWKKKARDNQEERKNDPKTPWDSGDLPEHERLRFDKLNRQRASDGSADASATIDGEPRVVGYPTVDQLAGPAPE